MFLLIKLKNYRFLNTFLKCLKKIHFLKKKNTKILKQFSLFRGFSKKLFNLILEICL